MEKQPTSVTISEIIGLILLTPPVVSVIMFFAGIFSKKSIYAKSILDNLHPIWSGDWGSSGDGGGGGYTSALPLYFGLMAIAGAYLIKSRKS